MAEKNTIADTRVENLGTMMSRLTGIPLPDEYEENESTPYVLTNQSGCKGASAVLDKATLREFAKAKKTDKIVVLPSSIHEIMVIPYYEGKTDICSLSRMVQEVNQTQVSPEEQLGSTAYVLSV